MRKEWWCPPRRSKQLAQLMPVVVPNYVDLVDEFGGDFFADLSCDVGVFIGGFVG